MATVKVQYAKTHLSELLKEVEAGREIVISRGAQPVARLVPLAGAMGPRELGFVRIEVPEEFFAPLDDEELGEWEDR